jgi:cytoskeletal protein CcmA (bactofilin family)
MAVEQVDTLVGVHVELKGSLHNQGAIHVHGRVTGDIVSESSIVIGETAIVTGPISAKRVDVSGQVHGSISAEEYIELHPKCLVKGDIQTARLSIKPGAIFNGKSTMSHTQETDDSKKQPKAEIE